MKTVRIAVREDGKLILGANFGLLKPGKVYEITSPIGSDDEEDFLIREVGDSCVNGYLSQRDDTPSPAITWGSTANSLIESGNLHLHTKQEYALMYNNGNKEQE